MSRPPQYAPKSRYRTRQSGSEVDAIDDNSATAIDRIVPDLEKAAEQRARAEAAATARPAAPAPSAKSSRGLVIGLSIALGIAILVAAALGAAVVILLSR